MYPYKGVASYVKMNPLCLQQQLGDNPAYSFGETVSGEKSGISTQGSDLNRSQQRLEWSSLKN
jgi:hypothetical protein